MSKLSGCHVRSMRRTRLSRHLVTTIMSRYLRAIYTRANWIHHSHRVLSSNIDPIGPSPPVSFASYYVQPLTSLLLSWMSSICSCSSFLRPFCCGALATCSSTLFPSDAIVVHGWLECYNDRDREIREERLKERNRNGKRDGGHWSGGVEKIAIRNRMLIYLMGISFGYSILNNNLKKNNYIINWYIKMSIKDWFFW